MQEILYVLSNTAPATTINTKSFFPYPGKPTNLPSRNSGTNDFSKRTFFHCQSFSSKATSVSFLSSKAQQTKEFQCLPIIVPPSPAQPPQDESDFQEKVLYLDSIGLDISSLITHDHDRAILLSSPLPTIKSTLDYLLSTLALSSIELRRLIAMCPEILSLSSSTIAPVFTFLLREAGVNSTFNLKLVIIRRPRLLVSSVPHRLRPTLYFLQSIGISKPQKHTYLLSCSVEDKLLPKIHYFQGIGFAYRDAVSMFRSFPQLFNHSVKDNFEPKLNYFLVEMGRDLKELKEFPQYFSFSIENRIKPRHRRCMDREVYFPLPALLKTSEAEFQARLNACCNASLPLRSSPLYHVYCDVNRDEEETCSDSNIKG